MYRFNEPMLVETGEIPLELRRDELVGSITDLKEMVLGGRLKINQMFTSLLR